MAKASVVAAQTAAALERIEAKLDAIIVALERIEAKQDAAKTNSQQPTEDKKK